MLQKNFALSKINYMICAAAVFFIVVGFVVMAIGPSSTVEGGFAADIFSTRRIKVAPMISLFGFVLMVVGILYPSDKKADNADQSNLNQNKK